MKKNSINFTNGISQFCKTAIYLAPILLCSLDATADFDPGKSIGSIADPLKKIVLDYYPVGIFVGGLVGALLKTQGDLRERMVGFGLGSLAGGLTVTAVKSGFGL